MSVEEQTSLESPSPPQRVRVNCNEVNLEQFKKHWQEQDKYVDYLSGMMHEVEERLKQHMQDSARRENVLVMRLTTKEHELQDLLAQVTELKASQSPGLSALRSHLLDPAVNLTLEKIKKELAQSKSQVENIQNELNAWKFTPDSHTGKRLMAKCRMLLAENEELGQMVSTGRLAKLEGDLALQKNLCATLKNSQAELDELLPDLDEDVEGMQVTIYHLQQQLKEAKEQLQKLQNTTTTHQLNGDIVMEERTSENSQTKDRTKEAASDKERNASDVAPASWTSAQSNSSNNLNGQEDWSVNALDSRTTEQGTAPVHDCCNHVQQPTNEQEKTTNDESCLFQNNVETEEDGSERTASRRGGGRKKGGRRTRRRSVTNNSQVSNSVPADSCNMVPSPKRTRSSVALMKEPLAPEPQVENGLSPEEKMDTSF